jgi:signal peptidase II
MKQKKKVRAAQSLSPHALKAGLVILLTLILDQASKVWMKGLLLSETGAVQKMITPFFNLTPVWNRGVSFGMLQADHGHQMILLIVVAAAITGFLVRWLLKAETWLSACALALTIGGALGNIIDRLLFGAVFDFLDFHLYGYHWPAFNVADSAICAGLAILLLESLLSPKIKTQKK